MRRSTNAIAGCRGFTIVEAIVAGGLVAITLASGVVGLLTMYQSSQKARLLAAASARVQEQVEKVMVATFNPIKGDVDPLLNIGNASSTTTNFTVALFTNSSGTTNTAANMTMTVQNATRTINGRSINMRRVTVEAVWRLKNKTTAPSFSAGSNATSYSTDGNGWYRYGVATLRSQDI